jgi:hypothetical protein
MRQNGMSRDVLNACCADTPEHSVLSSAVSPKLATKCLSQIEVSLLLKIEHYSRDEAGGTYSLGRKMNCNLFVLPLKTPGFR